MMSGKRPKPHPRSSPEINRGARALRQDMTGAERILCEQLRNHRFHGLQFRRQHPIHRFIVDFYCAARLLVLEVDGEQHAEQQDYDAERTAWLAEHGYRVLRVRNMDVKERLGEVLSTLEYSCGIEQ